MADKSLGRVMRQVEGADDNIDVPPPSTEPGGSSVMTSNQIAVRVKTERQLPKTSMAAALLAAATNYKREN